MSIWQCCESNKKKPFFIEPNQRKKETSLSSFFYFVGAFQRISKKDASMANDENKGLLQDCVLEKT
jgi:hypothetical protein